MSLEEKLTNLLGGRGWIGAADSAPWRRDWLDKFGEISFGIAQPASTVEVSEIIKLCASAGVPAASQGGNTSLAGGAVLAHAGGIIPSLSRMNAIGVVDNVSNTITVEAGTVLAHLHEQLDESRLIGPNAGGSHAFRNKMMQDLVLCLEAVLPDRTRSERQCRLPTQKAVLWG